MVACSAAQLELECARQSVEIGSQSAPTRPARAIHSAVPNETVLPGVVRRLDHQKSLFGIHPADPLTRAAVAFLLGSTAILASYIPARCAMRVESTHSMSPRLNPSRLTHANLTSTIPCGPS